MDWVIIYNKVFALEPQVNFEKTGTNSSRNFLKMIIKSKLLLYYDFVKTHFF